MNRVKFLQKIIFTAGFALALAFTLTACDNGGGDDDTVDSALNGTWVGSEIDDETGEIITFKIVLNNGSFTQSMDNVELMKGTYSTNGSNITIVFTQVSGAIFGEGAGQLGLSASQLYTQQQLKEAIVQFIMDRLELPRAEAEALYASELEEDFSEIFAPQTGTYTLSGNTLTTVIDGETTVFTRQQ